MVEYNYDDGYWEGDNHALDQAWAEITALTGELEPLTGGALNSSVNPEEPGVDRWGSGGDYSDNERYGAWINAIQNASDPTEMAQRISQQLETQLEIRESGDGEAGREAWENRDPDMPEEAYWYGD